MSKNASAPIWASQNFLTSAATIRQLIRKSDIRPGDLVYEIGPGKGHITRQLLALGARVRAIELDPKLCDRLDRQFAGEPRFSLIRGDFLTLPLPKTGDYKVFSNIPFSLTTAILRRLTESQNPPVCAGLIMEKGAAMRFCGRPGENLSSLTLRPYFAADIAARVSRQEFHPQPKVDAALLVLHKKQPPDLPLNQRKSFSRFVRCAREKGLRTLLTKRQIAAALRACPEAPADMRDGNLLYVQWLCLFRWWARYKNN